MRLRSTKPGTSSAISDRFMWARVLMLWVKIRDGLWFIPAVFTAFGATLAIALVHIERLGWISWPTWVQLWLLSGGADGARAVLGAIVGGLMTVTGVAFSVTIVALQLASSQFTPRVLRNFTADRVNQVFLGILIGTFTYAMMVLRAVRSDDTSLQQFVPHTSVAVGVLLALVSIGWLIYFINHAAASMRVSVILQRVTDETLQHIESYFPEPFDHQRAREANDNVEPADKLQPVAAQHAGHLQAVDTDALSAIAQREGVVIRMSCDVGEFIQQGQALAYIECDRDVDEQTIQTVCRGFVLGDERTPAQDVAFGIMEISDIAVKALSPGINDPTTAVHAIDRLTQILLELGSRSPPADRAEHGRVRFVSRRLGFDNAVGLAFDQIRHFGADNPLIAHKLMTALALLVKQVPHERRAPLIAQAEAALEDSRASMKSTVARRDLEQLEADFRSLREYAGATLIKRGGLP